MQAKLLFKAAIYLRVSREDGDKPESDSISNQRELMKDYLKGKPDICLCDEMIDDGYSGADFNRPGFMKLLEDLKSGRINCVLVKDFSRLGRDYVDTGRYLNNIFPSMGVRFIAVNDNYDSSMGRTAADHILIPFKNIINDSYCRDISIKIRSHLEVKRKRGDYVGSFVVFGYLKNTQNKHKLVVDDYAANIVRDIFRWKLDGLSQQGIADRLNQMGVLSPLEYKKSIGQAYATGFHTSMHAQGSAAAVGRILRNELSPGTMVQGKRTPPNHKVKKEIVKSRQEWVKIDGTHEAIISREDFQTVNKILLTDTRIAPQREKVYLLSGLVQCSECGSALTRRTVRREEKRYIYYFCPSCKGHSINCEELEAAAFQTVKAHIDNVLNIENVLDYIDTLSYSKEEMKKYNRLIEDKKRELSQYEEYKIKLSEMLTDGLIDKNEYLSVKREYSQQCDEAQRSLALLEEEIDKVLRNKSGRCVWIDTFKKYKSIDTLTRNMAVTLIDKIIVYQSRRIDIVFRYQFEYDSVISFIQSAEASVLREKVI